MPLAPPTRRSPRELLLAAEALLFLTLFRIALALIPVRRIIRAIVRGNVPASAVPPPAPPQGLAATTALRVRWAVEAVARSAPAAFVCFPQTLAGYAMLRLRRVPSTIVYGVARSPEGNLIAHTWLTVGDRIVLGGEGSAAFSPIERWT
jgi:hypothetical protein